MATASEAKQPAQQREPGKGARFFLSCNQASLPVGLVTPGRWKQAALPLGKPLPPAAGVSVHTLCMCVGTEAPVRLSYCDKEVCSILSRKLQEHARVLSSPWCAAYVHRQVWCVGLHRETLCLGPGEETQPSRRTSDTLRACWATWSSPLASHKKQH